MAGKYVTVGGDMWDTIAWRKMGSENYTAQLMQANRKYIEYYRFPAGIELEIPTPDKPLNSTLPPWKRGGGA